MIPDRLVLATRNSGKVVELGSLVREWGRVDVLPLSSFPAVVCPEEGVDSYAANAIAKARVVAAATGLPALADDSGLEVVALHGGPGVQSARYGDTDAACVARLLDALRTVPEAGRRARFCCVVALAWSDGRAVTAEGECRGRIARAPDGEGGFGYDPVFVADELGRTLAAVPAAEKARISHRAHAMRALGERLGRPCP